MATVNHITDQFLSTNNVVVSALTFSTIISSLCSGNSTQWNDVYSTFSVLSTIAITSGGNTRNDNMTIGTNDAYHLRFETNNSPRMTILSGGEVGIGTTISETAAAGNGGLIVKNNLLVGGNTTISTLNTSTTDNSVIVEASGVLNKRTINSRVWDTDATFLSGSPTTNTILKSTGPNTVGNSTITDNGTTVTVAANTNITGTLTASNFRQPGTNNIGVGTGAASTMTGSNNVAVGVNSISKASGNFNVALGNQSLENNTSGQFNTAVGQGALNTNQTGSNNTAVGVNALLSNTGSGNIGIGVAANLGAGLNNCIVIGNNASAGSSGELVLGSAANPLTTAATAGAISTYLQVRINGTLYKLALLAVS